MATATGAEVHGVQLSSECSVPPVSSASSSAADRGENTHHARQDTSREQVVRMFGNPGAISHFLHLCARLIQLASLRSRPKKSRLRPDTDSSDDRIRASGLQARRLTGNWPRPMNSVRGAFFGPGGRPWGCPGKENKAIKNWTLPSKKKERSKSMFCELGVFKPRDAYCQTDPFSCPQCKQE